MCGHEGCLGRDCKEIVNMHDAIDASSSEVKTCCCSGEGEVVNRGKVDKESLFSCENERDEREFSIWNIKDVRQGVFPSLFIF